MWDNPQDPVFGISLYRRSLELRITNKYFVHITQAFANYRDCFVDKTGCGGH